MVVVGVRPPVLEPMPVEGERGGARCLRVCWWAGRWPFKVVLFLPWPKPHRPTTRTAACCCGQALPGPLGLGAKTARCRRSDQGRSTRSTVYGRAWRRVNCGRAMTSPPVSGDVVVAVLCLAAQGDMASNASKVRAAEPSRSLVVRVCWRGPLGRAFVAVLLLLFLSQHGLPRAGWVVGGVNLLERGTE